MAAVPPAQSAASAPKPPLASTIALIAALLVPGLVLFIDSATGRAFYRQVFEPLYTLGMILALGVYALAGFSLTGLAWIAAVAAWRRRESPRWLRWTAIAASLAAPLLAVMLMKGI